MGRSVIVAAMLVAACGPSGTITGLGPQASGLSPEHVVDAGVVDAAVPPEVDASVDAALDAPPPLTIPTDYTPAKGKRTSLERDKAISVGHGLKVTIASAGHKHRVDGGAVGFYELTFTRGGKKSSLRISVDDEPIEYEVDALGILLVLTSDGGPIEATAVGKTPRPLDEDAAAEAIAAAATRVGLPVGDTSYSNDNGVINYVYTENGIARWRARMGLYTKRIWFLPPRPSD